MLMTKLLHNKKVVLDNIKYASSTFEISFGLMFATKKRIRKGIILRMPTVKDVKFGASVTMLFVFHKLEILFVNKEMEVVDKVILKPFVPSYTPKKPAMYVIESEPGTFKSIKVGDKVEIDR